MSTLSDGTTTVTLPANLDWSDEFHWHPVEQATEYSLDGALLIDEATRQAGRPVTLRAGRSDMGFVPKATLDQLRQWADLPGQVLTLTLDDGRSLSVRFNHADKAISAVPVREYRVPAGTAHDLWRVVLKFIEV